MTNPATLDALGTVPDMAGNETRRAIEAARESFAEWRRRPEKERAAVLSALFRLLAENARDLATLMTLEQGKPLSESTGEVKYGSSFIRMVR